MWGIPRWAMWAGVGIAALFVVGLHISIPSLGDSVCATDNVSRFTLCKIAVFLDGIAVSIAALATVAIAFVTWALFRTSSKQNELTRILQRAYITVDPLGIKLRIQETRIMGFVGIKNAGNLPAEHVNWSTGICYSTDNSISDFPPLSQQVGDVICAPGTVMSHGTRDTILVSDIQAAANTGAEKWESGETEIFVYVYGRVEYHDGFRGGRSIEFCHRYNWLNRGRASAAKFCISKRNARYHKHGNRTDESPSSAA